MFQEENKHSFGDENPKVGKNEQQGGGTPQHRLERSHQRADHQTKLLDAKLHLGCYLGQYNHGPDQAKEGGLRHNNAKI